MSADDMTAPGPDADYCPDGGGEGHAISVHMSGGALASVRRCYLCGWIDFDDLDRQVREARTPATGPEPGPEPVGEHDVVDGVAGGQVPGR